MELLLYSLLLIASLSVLIKSADFFVEGAKDIGIKMGISPFVIGVTVVALGTSLPELATSISAVLNDTSEVVIANVVGSNIANLLVVIGIAAIISRRLTFEYKVLDIDLPLLFISSLLMYLVLLDRDLSLSDSLLFLFGFVIFMLNSVTSGAYSYKVEPRLQRKAWWYVIGGSILIWLSSEYTIVAIKKLSMLMGVPTDLIAVTAVALGTSLPEVMVSVMAATKGQNAIAVGNVLGSNIFNTYFVTTIPSFLGKLKVSDAFIHFHIPFMVGMTVVFAVISLTRRISLWEGCMLIAFYIYYLSHIMNEIQ